MTIEDIMQLRCEKFFKVSKFLMVKCKEEDYYWELAAHNIAIAIRSGMCALLAKYNPGAESLRLLESVMDDLPGIPTLMCDMPETLIHEKWYSTLDMCSAKYECWCFDHLFGKAAQYDPVEVITAFKVAGMLLQSLRNGIDEVDTQQIISSYLHETGRADQYTYLEVYNALPDIYKDSKDIEAVRLAVDAVLEIFDKERQS